MDENEILATLNKECRSQVEFGTLGKDLTKEKERTNRSIEIARNLFYYRKCESVSKR